MAVETYGVDQTHVQSYLPQVDVGANSPVTSDRLTEIIQGAAARVNAAIRGAGIDPADVASDTSSDWYRAAQRIVMLFVRPDLLDAAHHPTAHDVRADLLEEAYDELERLRQNIRSALGYDAATTLGPAAVTSTSRMGLDVTTETEIAKRRHFDGRRGAKKEGRYVW